MQDILGAIPFFFLFFFILWLNLCETTSSKPNDERWKKKDLCAAPSRLSLTLCKTLQRLESAVPLQSF